MVSLAPVPDPNQLLPPESSCTGHRGHGVSSRRLWGQQIQSLCSQAAPLRPTPHVSLVHSRFCQRPASPITGPGGLGRPHPGREAHSSPPPQRTALFQSLKGWAKWGSPQAAALLCRKAWKKPVATGSPCKMFQQVELRQVCLWCLRFWLARHCASLGPRVLPIRALTRSCS